MEKKKIGNILADAENTAKDALGKAKEKTIQIVDQNDDGKFDMADVSAVADAVGDAMKKGVAAVKESAEENRKRIELKALQPIFPDTIDQTDFLMSKLIRIVDKDKKHAASDVCQGSIGFLSDKGGLRIVNIYRESTEAFGLTFYPDADYEFYYVNPTDRDNYIALDEYFTYLKMVRINELQRVAQDLGAKYFKVTYKEELTSFSEFKGKVKAAASKGNKTSKTSKESKKLTKGDIDGERVTAEKEFSMVDVAAEMHMAGHTPQRPKLVYLLKDDNVQNLIHMRMTGGEDFHNHKISIRMSNTSGIKESDAMKIDAALKGMKVSGNATVISEAKNESRRYLEYEIEF